MYTLLGCPARRGAVAETDYFQGQALFRAWRGGFHHQKQLRPLLLAKRERGGDKRPGGGFPLRPQKNKRRLSPPISLPGVNYLPPVRRFHTVDTGCEKPTEPLDESPFPAGPAAGAGSYVENMKKQSGKYVEEFFPNIF